ncbi:MAG TPA: hypothetical protein DHS57_00885 [Erysipelotrichaceae bacterium]|nr:hypothetical protein [Erysipelotrichaceae bacterium]
MAELASDKYLELKKEVSRMASMANKRLVRLERNELTELPAYKSWQENGSIRFSVRGKDYNELQAEFWRLKNFLDNKTSLVRQANKFLKDMAKTTGIKYGNLTELKAKSKQFFELANKAKEYYKMANQSALALDYQKIWEQINTQIKEGDLKIGEGIETDELLEQFLEKMKEVEKVEDNQEGYKENISEWDFIKL